MQHKILVIVPAYDEESTIRRVVNSIYRAADVDVLVVNDGSDDGTAAVAKGTPAQVVDLPNNLGIGGAMQTGYLYAQAHGYDIAVQIDADGQHDPHYIDALIQPLVNGDADMVIGSRYKEKTQYHGSVMRRVGSFFFTSLIALFTGKVVHDTTSGFRAVNREVIEHFARHYPQDYPEVDVIVQLSKCGYRICEIAVEMHERQGGRSSITPLKSVYYMCKVTLAIILNAMGSAHDHPMRG